MEYDILTIVEQIDEQAIEQAVELFILLVVWSLVWKGIALWKAARHDSVPWFVALLIINTFGILEILYVFVFSNPKVFKTKLEQETMSEEDIQRELDLMKKEEKQN